MAGIAGCNLDMQISQAYLDMSPAHESIYAISKTEYPCLISPSQVNRKSAELGHNKATTRDRGSEFSTVSVMPAFVIVFDGV